MKLEQNHANALLYVSKKQSSLKILRHLALFFKRFEILVWNKDAFPHSRMAAFKICDKIDNLDQKFSLMTFSERKNENFQSKGNINITAYFLAQAFSLYQFYVLKYDALTSKHI